MDPREISRREFIALGAAALATPWLAGSCARPGAQLAQVPPVAPRISTDRMLLGIYSMVDPQPLTGYSDLSFNCYTEHLVPPEAHNYVHFWVLWAEVEPQKGAYEAYFRKLERLCEHAEQHGHLVEITFRGHAPLWACKSDPKSIRHMRDWTDILTALATRLRGRVMGYKLWHEGNLKDYWAGTPREYFHGVYRLGVAAIKAADPGARVMTAGPSPWPEGPQIFGTLGFDRAGGYPGQVLRYLDTIMKDPAIMRHVDAVLLNVFPAIPFTAMGAANGSGIVSATDYYRWVRQRLDERGWPGVEFGIDESCIGTWLDYKWAGGPSKSTEAVQAEQGNQALGEYFDSGGNKYACHGPDGMHHFYSIGMVKAQDVRHELPDELLHILPTGERLLRVRAHDKGTKRTEPFPAQSFPNPLNPAQHQQFGDWWYDWKDYTERTDPSSPVHPAYYIYLWWGQIAPYRKETYRCRIHEAGYFGGAVYKVCAWNATDREMIVLIYQSLPGTLPYSLSMDARWREQGFGEGCPLVCEWDTRQIDYAMGKSQDVTNGTLRGPQVRVEGGRIRIDLEVRLERWTRLRIRQA